jgi:type IV secretion system protein VirB4
VHHPELPLRPSEIENIETAVQRMATMPSNLRWLSTVLDQLDKGGPQLAGDNVYDRLKRWCRGGALEWVFDCKRSTLPSPHEVDLLGIDYTKFLGDEQVRGPILLMLLQYFEEVIDQGHRLMAVIVELWRAAQDQSIAAFLKDQIKTIRKKGGLLIYDTQEPKDAINSSVGDSLISQTSTLALLPDKDADEATYCGKLKLTQAQFLAFQDMTRRRRRQLMIVQGNQSVIVNFDLKALPEHLAILSFSPADADLLDLIRAEVGDDPKDWLPVYRARVARKTQPLKAVA